MPSAGVMEQHLEAIDEHGRSIKHARGVVLGAIDELSPVHREAVTWAMDQLTLTFRPLPAQASVCDGSRKVAGGILRTGSVTGWLGRKVKAAVEDEARLAAAGLLSLPDAEPLALASGD